MIRHLLISGRVQGVGYRHNLRREALGLRLTGWVRNRLDGSVEALLEGPPDAVAALITWARRGPPAARVEGVAVREAGAADAGPFEGFDLLETA